MKTDNGNSAEVRVSWLWEDSDAKCITAIPGLAEKEGWCAKLLIEIPPEEIFTTICGERGCKTATVFLPDSVFIILEGSHPCLQGKYQSVGTKLSQSIRKSSLRHFFKQTESGHHLEAIFIEKDLVLIFFRNR